MSKGKTALSAEALDCVGVAASFICGVHCLLTPLLFALLPLFGLKFLKDERFDWMIILVSVVIGTSSLVPSYLRRHRLARPMVLFGSGIILLIVARESDPLFAEIPIAVGGASPACAPVPIGEKGVRSIG